MSINKDSFILLEHKRVIDEKVYVYITNKTYAGGFLLTLEGVVLKTDLGNNLYDKFEKIYTFNSNNYIFKDIKNNKEIEELSLIYKIHLLQNS